jgi:hypothetical protein
MFSEKFGHGLLNVGCFRYWRQVTPLSEWGMSRENLLTKVKSLSR